MSNRFKVNGNITYLNMNGDIVSARKGNVIVMPRRRDVQKHLKAGMIEPADSDSRKAHTMTTANINLAEETLEIDFEEGDFVSFEYYNKAVNGEVRSVSAKGVLTVDIGIGDEEKLVKVDPTEKAVENHK